ncbi:MAG: N-acetylneuraminate synthase family protein [Chthoniobacterales bacterium]
MKTVKLGSIPVGDGFPTVFVAETGSFFNKEVDTACKYITAVAKSGADIFKTEIIHDANICLANTGTMVSYAHAGGKSTEVYREHVERKQLSLKEYAHIFAHARSIGIPFLATVFDYAGIDFLKSEGGCAIKISRNNINNVPLIRYAAQSKLPIIFDEGFIYLDELAFGIRCAREAGCDDIIVNYHPGLNPAPADRHNLKVIETYKTTFGIPIGLACHFRGDEILYTAIGAGVNIIEKGVDDNPDREEADLVSATPMKDLAAVVANVKACWKALGDPRPQPPEPRDLSSRCCIVAAKPIAADTILKTEDLRFAWPPVGISTRDWDCVIGSKTTRAIEKDQPLNWEDIQSLR